MSRAIWGMLSLSLGLWLLGCSTHYIKGTPLEDTSDNVEVVTFMDQYRLALEARDVEALVALASTDYKDTAGTQDLSDDLEFKSLRDKLTRDLGMLEQLRVQINYREIVFEDELVRVRYQLVLSYQAKLETGPKVFTRADNVQMTLRREHDKLRILSGL